MRRLRIWWICLSPDVRASMLADLALLAASLSMAMSALLYLVIAA